MEAYGSCLWGDWRGARGNLRFSLCGIRKWIEKFIESKFDRKCYCYQEEETEKKEGVRKGGVVTERTEKEPSKRMLVTKYLKFNRGKNSKATLLVTKFENNMTSYRNTPLFSNFDKIYKNPWVIKIWRKYFLDIFNIKFSSNQKVFKICSTIKLTSNETFLDKFLVSFLFLLKPRLTRNK